MFYPIRNESIVDLRNKVPENKVTLHVYVAKISRELYRRNHFLKSKLYYI